MLTLPHQNLLRIDTQRIESQPILTIQEVFGAALSALAIIGQAAPEQHRAGVLSTIYLLAYLSLGAVALGLGIVATNSGLAVAVDLGSLIIGGLSLAKLIFLTALR
jgi:hypothetical protein